MSIRSNANMNSLYTIRNATADDAAILAQLAERTFRAAFKTLNTAENMNLHCAASYSEELQHAEITDPKIETLVVQDADELIAYVQLHWGSASDCVQSTNPAEIRRFYVDTPWHGKNVARELMTEVLHRVDSRGSEVAWLGVWEHNPRAISFYRKWGFKKVGDHAFYLGEDRQLDLIFASIRSN